MLRKFAKAFLATFHGLRRPSRRNAPSLVGLEDRTLLSGRALDRSLKDSVHSSEADDAGRVHKAVKPNKTVAFVNGLYHTYFHHAPTAAMLNQALDQLASGVSSGLLRRDFQIVTAKTNLRVSSAKYVQALYAVFVGRAPTPTGQAYWVGQINSGLSRKQVRQMFQASNGMLPPPTLSWESPGTYIYGTALDGTQLNATASVPGTFIYMPPAGTVLNAISFLPLSVDFYPTDSADYPFVSMTVPINIYAAAPAIIWFRPHAIEVGTPLSDLQLNAYALWSVNGQDVVVPGTFTYSSPAGTVLPVGTNLALTAVFRPYDSLDYTSVVKTTNITVTEGPPLPTPTPTPAPPPSPPSPTPSPTPNPNPFPTPSPFPFPPPTPFIANAIASSYRPIQRVTPPPTPPPTPLGIIPTTLIATSDALLARSKFLLFPDDLSNDTVKLTPPPTI